MFRGASEGKEKRQTEPLAVSLHNSGPGQARPPGAYAGKFDALLTD
jgi:hypothetical protein